MKRFLSKYKASRWGYDGWAVKVEGHVLGWSVCSTREEVREVAREYASRFGNEDQLELFGRAKLPEIVKVRINVQEVPIPPHHKDYVQEQIV